MDGFATQLRDCQKISVTFGGLRNLSSGLAFSESAEVFDEIGSVFHELRSQMATDEGKQNQNREKIADPEEVKPRTQVRRLLDANDRDEGNISQSPQGAIVCR